MSRSRLVNCKTHSSLKREFSFAFHITLCQQVHAIKKIQENRKQTCHYYNSLEASNLFSQFPCQEWKCLNISWFLIIKTIQKHLADVGSWNRHQERQLLWCSTSEWGWLAYVFCITCWKNRFLLSSSDKVFSQALIPAPLCLWCHEWCSQAGMWCSLAGMWLVLIWTAHSPLMLLRLIAASNHLQSVCVLTLFYGF